MVLHNPEEIADRLCLMCIINEQPPTEVPSIHSGCIPRYWAMVIGFSPAVAIPSTSDIFKPASANAFKAPSACNWTCDRLGMSPKLVVSAAPITTNF